MKPAMEILLQRPDKLALTTGEMFPATRGVDEDVLEGVAEMEGVEHLGQYVFEMTQAKVKSLGGMVDVKAVRGEEDGYADGEAGEELEIVDEEDPLHETVVV
jgi:intron-binding protein aquarius